MGAVDSISNVSASVAVATVSRMASIAQAAPRAAISAIKKIVSHKSPPAGLLVFDPYAPDVDLTGMPLEQIRALHQYRTSLQLLSPEDEGVQADSQA